MQKQNNQYMSLLKTSFANVLVVAAISIQSILLVVIAKTLSSRLEKTMR